MLKKLTTWISSLKGTKTLPVSYSKDYSETWYEMETLKQSLTDLSDSDLIQEVADLCQTYASHQVGVILQDFLITGALDPDDRKDLEHFYVFVNMEMGISV